MSGVALPALAQGGLTSLSFADAPVGSLPAGFMIARTGKGAAAEWKVVEDSSVSTGRALAQASTDRVDYRFPLAIYQPLTAANVAVSVRFKAVAGELDRAAGIAVRLTDPNNYYVVRANALEDNVNLYRVIQGNRSLIHGMRHKVPSNEWHTLGLRLLGDRFTVSFDGAELFTATDRSFAGNGKVALWTKADSITRFDALTIQALP
jgi:hypothetical protein